MATDIFYFSGTGNSIAISQKIAAKLDPAHLIPIAAIDELVFVSMAETVVFVFPVYAGGIPALLSKKMLKIRVQSKAHVVAIAHCAEIPGAAIDTFCQDFAGATGRKVAASYILRMPGNYTPLYGADTDENIQKILKNSEESLEQIIEQVRNKTPIKTDFLPGAIYWLNRLAWKVFAMNVGRSGRRFKVEADCNRCGLCERLCPVNNIKIGKSGLPFWQDNCEQCMACLQYCPQAAIQCFWWTKGRKRYHHPKISATRIAAQKYMPRK